MTQIVTWTGCQTCNDLKKAGMCKKNECIDINTKKGTKIAKQAKVTTVPQCVTKKNGKIVKCNTQKIIKKFLK